MVVLNNEKTHEKNTAKINQEKSRGFVRNLLGKDKPPEPIDTDTKHTDTKRLIWIINPANGHAYAKIPCQNWHDAQRKAIDENAHLVSINNQQELLWVQAIFTSPPYWIGLNDIEDEGIWRWDSGEPVTFSNWTNNKYFGDNSPDSEKDFVAMVYNSSWEAVGLNVANRRRIQYAIIEKDGLISKIAKSKESTDK